MSILECSIFLSIQKMKAMTFILSCVCLSLTLFFFLMMQEGQEHSFYYILKYTGKNELDVDIESTLAKTNWRM